MTKNIFKMLLVAVLLSGCYEDKGNYDYTLDSMNEITSVKFTPEIIETSVGKVIEVRQALTENDVDCRIEAHLEQTLEKNLDNLDFYWYRTYNDNSGEKVKDTICTKGFLELELPLGGMLEQDILLRIYDRTTTLSHYSSFKFRTRPPFKNSLFVLHGEDGDRKLGNIEIIGKDTIMYTDVNDVTKDDNVYQYASGFDYSAYDGNIALTLFGDNGATRIYEPFGMKVKFFAEEIFKPQTTDFQFKKMIRIGDPGTNTYCVALSEDGELLTGGSLPVLFKTGYDQELNGNTDHITDYNITAATMTRDNYFFWDDKEKRFLYSATENIVYEEEDARDMNLKSTHPVLDANVDFSQFPEIKDMTAIYGYLECKEDWDKEYKDFYFIFKDPSGSYYRCELSTGAKNGVNDICTIKEVKAMNGFIPSDPSLIKYCSYSSSTDYVFYANGNTVYRYNVSNYDHEEVYRAPDGYDVTMIKFRTDFFSPGGTNQVGDLNRIMSIGLYNNAEANGAIAEIKFTTAADIDDDFTPLFYDKDNNGNKWGRIKDMQFAHEYQYEIADYLKEENQ